MQKPSPRLFADSIEPITRESPDQVFFIRIEGRPQEDNPEALEVAGGYINIWIDTDVFRDAELQAMEAIQNEGWRPHRFDHWSVLGRDECPEEGLEAFDEAVEAGVSLSIFTWGHDEQMEDETEQDASSNH
jgi:hypothetical protein